MGSGVQLAPNRHPRLQIVALRAPCAEDEVDDTEGHVLVDTDQLFEFDDDAGLLEAFAASAVLDCLAELEKSSRRLPTTVVLALDQENPVVIVNRDSADTYPVQGDVAHLLTPAR
jgi:hypothetical protein